MQPVQRVIETLLSDEAPSPQLSLFILQFVLCSVKRKRPRLQPMQRIIDLEEALGETDGSPVKDAQQKLRKSPILTDPVCEGAYQRRFTYRKLVNLADKPSRR
jgi:hypothetical protein